METGFERFGHDFQHGRPTLSSQSIAVEIDVEPHVLRPTLAAAKPSVSLVPLGLPYSSAEDCHDLLDGNGPVVTAHPACNDEICAFDAQIFK